MKKLVIVMVCMGLVGSVSAYTYSEDFDTDANWVSDGSMGSYTAKAYTNTVEDPEGDYFESGPCVRETSAVNSGAYAWRLDDIADISVRYVVSDVPAVESFSVYTADWDVSDDNTFEIRYSTDAGSSYTTLVDTDATYYTEAGLGDKEYKQYVSGNINAVTNPTIYIEVYNKGGDERILVDDFSVTIIPEPALLALAPLALLALRRR
jgi:hypothetical protein